MVAPLVSLTLSLSPGSGGPSLDSDYPDVNLGVGNSVLGLTALVGFGLIGSAQMAVLAPLSGQFPLIAGFTLELPWAIPQKQYDLEAVRRYGLDVPAYLAGQRFGLGPVRSHTTGLIQAGVVFGVPGASEALDLVHPGRSSTIAGDQQGRGVFSPNASIVPLSIGDKVRES